MKILTGKVNYPSSKKSARNLCVVTYELIRKEEKKERNIMDQISKNQEKIEKLKENLAGLEYNLKKLKESKESNLDLLRKLQNEFDLTESEILELHASQLRTALKETERDLHLKGTAEIIEPESEL